MIWIRNIRLACNCDGAKESASPAASTGASTSVAKDAAIKTDYLAEANPIFTTGSMPDYPKYVEETKKKLVDAGIDKVMAEIQKQYDAWKAENK
ncbi:hypothetical protein GCM10008018_21300 [Paenibacillus marchantiophytorum]|uniref:DUF3502 domain-containing protein n=1 Tax=Paenibacillus marchantiophytorum TaxID=1619310 RepID=A0ABQ1EK84_9BACL|nr:DUF3502 domain-containing protein [Paenibacillus marchantiophytorum]GFZ75830.1 hypothetical protein GCM10008018_21300 [Paenibacillus marchantiophytorum]